MTTPLIDTTYFVQSELLKGNNPNTCHRYGRVAERFAQWAYDNDFFYTPLTSTDAVRYLNELGDSLAPASLRMYAAALKAYFEWKDGDTGKLAAYKLPSLPDPTPHPLPGGMVDARKIIDAANGQLKVMVALQALAGLRVAEARRFDSSMVDRDRKEIVITGKGNKIRRIPISTELWSVLDMFNVPINGKHCIVQFSDRGARTGVTRTATRAGVVGFNNQQVSSHDLRATFATAVYEKTGDILLVSKLLGHASVTTTQVYLGIGDKAKKAAVEL